MNTLQSQNLSLFKAALGNYIAKLRVDACLTQQALASKAGLTRVTLAEIEKGAANPSLKALAQIAEALELRLSDLLSSGVSRQSRYIMQPTSGNLYEPLVKQLAAAPNGTLNMQVAYAKSSGVDLLTAPLQAFRRAGGRLQALVGIDQHNTTAEALYKLMNLCHHLYVVHDRAFAQTYHPKVYIVSTAEQAWVAVGSGNLTRGGLCTNYEACHTQVLNLADFSDRQSYQLLTDTLKLYQESDLVKEITSADDIRALFADGLIITEQQSRQNSAKRSNWAHSTPFGHRAVSNTPSASEAVPVPAHLFTAELPPARDAAISSESEITAGSFRSLEISSSVQATYWFEMRASTGGSRNILDLSSSAKLQAGSHPQLDNGSIPGSVTFFGLDPKSHEIEKDITVVYNGIAYYPSTIKFAPNNASWRIQLKGAAETGDQSLSQFGRTDFANHILIFHRVTSEHYILETMAETELASLKQNSEFWATNGISRTSKAFGQIKLTNRI